MLPRLVLTVVVVFLLVGAVGFFLLRMRVRLDRITAALTGLAETRPGTRARTGTGASRMTADDD